MNQAGQTPLVGWRALGREIAGQAGRFAAVGTFNAVFSFAAFNALLLLGLTPIPANVISVTVGMFVSFHANRALVFRRRGEGAVKQAVLFFATTSFGMYVLQTAVISLLLDVWTWPLELTLKVVRIAWHPQGMAHDILLANLAKVAATVVSLTWNFLAYRYIVFRRR